VIDLTGAGVGACSGIGLGYPEGTAVTGITLLVAKASSSWRRTSSTTGCFADKDRETDQAR